MPIDQTSTLVRRNDDSNQEILIRYPAPVQLQLNQLSPVSKFRWNKYIYILSLSLGRKGISFWSICWAGTSLLLLFQLEFRYNWIINGGGRIISCSAFITAGLWPRHATHSNQSIRTSSASTTTESTRQNETKQKKIPDRVEGKSTRNGQSPAISQFLFKCFLHFHRCPLLLFIVVGVVVIVSGWLCKCFPS